jgi:hypothetical protein
LKEPLLDNFGVRQACITGPDAMTTVLIAVIQSAKTVASLMTAFRSATALADRQFPGMQEVRYLGSQTGAVDPKHSFILWLLTSARQRVAAQLRCGFDRSSRASGPVRDADAHS